MTVEQKDNSAAGLVSQRRILGRAALRMGHMSMRWVPVAIGLSAITTMVACKDIATTDSIFETFGPGTDTDGISSATSGATGSMGSSGPKFDLPASGDQSFDGGCAAVDFLFVIDNSISMQDQQNALKAAFPEFISTIQNTLPTTDYHIMVVDTDADGRCSPSTCTHSTCQEANRHACGDQFDACDTIRGGGVVHPAGQGASNMLCNLQGGNRYIIEGQPDLPGTFECVASVGLAGHPSERPLDGMVEAVSEALSAPGQCNDGFVRDDAILVVTVISDDPHIEDQNSAQQAYDAVLAAKNDNPDSIVMLGLVPSDQTHWSNFISMFGDRGIEGPVNGGAYDQFFFDAVSIIEDTCLGFEG